VAKKEVVKQVEIKKLCRRNDSSLAYAERGKKKALISLGLFMN
jgi:hypothetical protein